MRSTNGNTASNCSTLQILRDKIGRLFEGVGDLHEAVGQLHLHEDVFSRSISWCVAPFSRRSIPPSRWCC